MKTVFFILLFIPIIFVGFALIARENIPLFISVLVVFISGTLLGRYFWMHKSWDKNEHLDADKK